jgi:nanoRNase/pAp phosphatase (c-di-AMP/oligoRNAs hydrolase)
MKIPVRLQGVPIQRSGATQPRSETSSPDALKASEVSDTSALTLLESTRSVSAKSLANAGSTVSLQVATSMIGGLHGMVLAAISSEGTSFPSVRQMDVGPSEDGKTANLKLNLGVTPTQLKGAELTLIDPKAASVRAPTVLGLLEEVPERPLDGAPPQMLQALKAAATNPGELDCKQAVVDKLNDSKRTLLVCHVPPDGDTVGSMLGLSRLLKSLDPSRQVDICLDCEPPEWLRREAKPGELKNFDQIKQNDYDTMVVGDVAQAGRIGRAKEKLKETQDVVIIDHHDVDPTADELGMKEGATLTKWIEPKDATAVLISTLAEQMGAGKLTKEQWQDVSRPLVTALGTDIDHFKNPGVRPESAGVYNHLLNVRGDGDAQGAYKRTRAQLPAELHGLISGTQVLRNDMLSPEAQTLREKFAQLKPEARYSEELGHDFSVLRVPWASRELALETGRTLFDPETNYSDLDDILFKRLDKVKQDSDVSVILIEHEGHTQVGIRTKDPQAAIELGKHLGGGGKPYLAGAKSDQSIGEVEKQIRQWLDD